MGHETADITDPVDHESRRLASLRRYDILDTPPDGAFDRITAIAARLFRVPIAIVSLVDEDRIWFKSHPGMEAEQIPRAPGLCASAILSDEVYSTTDAAADPRTLANPLVAGEFGLRFYAGAPLRTDDGYRLGTLCVIDRAPREVSAEELATLEDLAALVMDEMELRRSARAAIHSEHRLLVRAEANRVAADELARTLQVTSLPPAIPRIPGVELAVAYRPAPGAIIGGDFYDFFPLPGGAWGIAVGDVCGKGAEAAALTAAVRYSLRGGAIHSADPAAALSYANHAIRIDAPTAWSRYCTVVFAMLTNNGDTFILQSAAGGHPLPIVIRAAGTVDTVGLPGSLIGILPNPRFTACETVLNPGDSVLLFTDGLSEARTEDAIFGEGLLHSVLTGCVRLTASEALARIEDAVTAQTVEQRDDRVILVMTITP